MEIYSQEGRLISSPMLDVNVQDSSSVEVNETRWMNNTEAQRHDVP